MKIDFLAQIKELNTKALVSGDLSTRINLESANLNIDAKKTLSEIQHTDKNASLFVLNIPA